MAVGDTDKSHTRIPIYKNHFKLRMGSKFLPPLGPKID